MTVIAEGCDPEPGFEQGLTVQQVLAAVETSQAPRAWCPVAR